MLISVLSLVQAVSIEREGCEDRRSKDVDTDAQKKCLAEVPVLGSGVLVAVVSCSGEQMYR